MTQIANFQTAPTGGENNTHSEQKSMEELLIACQAIVWQIHFKRQFADNLSKCSPLCGRSSG